MKFLLIAAAAIAIAAAAYYATQAGPEHTCEDAANASIGRETGTGAFVEYANAIAADPTADATQGRCLVHFGTNVGSVVTRYVWTRVDDDGRVWYGVSRNAS